MTEVLNLWDFEAVRRRLLDTRDAADFAALCIEAVAEWTGDDPEFDHRCRLNDRGQLVIDWRDGVIIVDPYAPEPLQVEAYSTVFEWGTQSAVLYGATGSRCLYAPTDRIGERLLRDCIIERLRVLWEFAKECRE